MAVYLAAAKAEGTFCFYRHLLRNAILYLIACSRMAQWQRARCDECSHKGRNGVGVLSAGELVEVNSGGQVLFCFFAPAGQVSGSRQRGTQSIDLGNLHQSSMAEQHTDEIAAYP